MSKSEFGKGLCYNLGLFLAHSEREHRASDNDKDYSMWFYCAADHLFDLQAERAPTKYLQGRCKAFRKKVLSLRLTIKEEKRPTKEDFNWAVDEAKTLLRLIDRAHGIKTEKGLE